MQQRENIKQVLEAVKEEVNAKNCQARGTRSNFRFNQFNRPELAYELHYFGSMSKGLPNGFNQPCFRDCLIFLLRGELIIKGQGRVTKTGCAYTVKDERMDLAVLNHDLSRHRGRGAEGCVSQMHARRARTHSGRDEIAQKIEEESWEVARGITVTTVFRTPSPTVVM